MPVWPLAMLQFCCAPCAAPVVAKRYQVSFMPHWESVPRGNWVSICQRAGVNYIDPGQSVTTVLDQLLASEVVITEAMHGAIVSDALRVPWIPVLPLRVSHRMKWHDWASALGLTLDFEKIVGPNAYEWTISRLESGRWRYRCDKYGSWLSNIDEPFAFLTARALKRLAGQRPYLSADRAIASAHQQMLEKLEQFKADLREPGIKALDRSTSSASSVTADQLSAQT